MVLRSERLSYNIFVGGYATLPCRLFDDTLLITFSTSCAFFRSVALGYEIWRNARVTLYGWNNFQGKQNRLSTVEICMAREDIPNSDFAQGPVHLIKGSYHATFCAETIERSEDSLEKKLRCRTNAKYCYTTSQRGENVSVRNFSYEKFWKFTLLESKSSSMKAKTACAVKTAAGVLSTKALFPLYIVPDSSAILRYEFPQPLPLSAEQRGENMPKVRGVYTLLEQMGVDLKLRSAAGAFPRWATCSLRGFLAAKQLNFLYKTRRIFHRVFFSLCSAGNLLLLSLSFVRSTTSDLTTAVVYYSFAWGAAWLGQLAKDGTAMPHIG